MASTRCGTPTCPMEPPWHRMEFGGRLAVEPRRLCSHGDLRGWPLQDVVHLRARWSRHGIEWSLAVASPLNLAAYAPTVIFEDGLYKMWYTYVPDGAAMASNGVWRSPRR